MMKRKTLITALAATGLLSLSALSTVQAAALATSTIQFNGLVFEKAGTGTALDFTTDFNVLTFSSTADASAALTGWATESYQGSSNSAQPIDLPGGTGGLPGANHNGGSPAGNDLCVGTCIPFAANTFPVISSNSGAPLATYSASDQNENGSPLANTPNGVALGANIAQAAYVGLLDGAGLGGSSNANNSISANWYFTVANAIAIDIKFDATAYIETFVSTGERFPTSATAAISSVLEIFDVTGGGAKVLSWAPDGILNGGGSTELGVTENSDAFSLNETRSSNSPLMNGICMYTGPACGTANSGFFSATTFVFDPDRQYSLSWRVNANADANNVPEPATLALMGIGLLGMGARAAKRRRS